MAHRWKSVCATAAAFSALVGLAAAIGGEPELISRATAGAALPRHSGDPAVSSSGRFVAFRHTLGSNQAEILMRDRTSGQTSRISRASGANGAAAERDSSNPSISGSGRYVAFDSTGISPGRESQRHIFVRDRQRDATEHISPYEGGNVRSEYEGHSSNPVISSSGRYVAFASKAVLTTEFPNDSGGPSGIEDIYVRDRKADRTILVSRLSGSAEAKGNGDSRRPAISKTGRYVAFDSRATNLSPDDDTSVPESSSTNSDVFVRDISTKRTGLISRASGADGAAGDAGSTSPSISANGRYVAFVSQARNLVPETASLPLRIDLVYVRDQSTRTTVLASRADGPGGTPLGAVFGASAAISANGRFVAFVTTVPEDQGGQSEVYLRDLATGQTIRVSEGATPGGSGRGSSFAPAFASGGGFLAFASDSDKISSADTDERSSDVFLTTLPAPSG